jgi:hypothetical protein
MNTDFTVENHGSIFLLQPHTADAQGSIDENLPDLESWQFHGSAVSVEHRYIVDIVDGIKEEGLTVA